MRKIVLLFGVLLIASSGFCQGMGQGRPYYDQSKVVTISGTIQRLDTITGRMGNFHLIRLTVRDSSGTTSVNVGPSSYLDEQKASFKVGDKVKVTGARMAFNGNDVIFAAQIEDGGKTIKLRDESGRPLWSRGGMMMRQR